MNNRVKYSQIGVTIIWNRPDKIGGFDAAAWIDKMHTLQTGQLYNIIFSIMGHNLFSRTIKLNIVESFTVKN